MSIETAGLNHLLATQAPLVDSLQALQKMIPNPTAICLHLALTMKITPCSSLRRQSFWISTMNPNVNAEQCFFSMFKYVERS
jgi:hypothetical protein